MDIYEEIVRLRRLGAKSALATIVRRVGSTPRKDHAKMLVRQDGTSLGTVGGGCAEAEVWQTAKSVMDSGRPTVLKFELTEDDAEKDGLVCGGTVEVFVEPILPDPQVVILGAGHLGQAIAEAAHRVGFKVVVLDDRESFASRERFPQAEEVIAAPFETALDSVRVDPDSFVLVVTRGHKYDQLALEKALDTGARYIGLVGSRRKIQIIVQNLLNKGISAEAFRNLYAPIGLDIGSETPEEIAVSVVAEFLAIIKGLHKRSPKQRFAMELLENVRVPVEN